MPNPGGANQFLPVPYGDVKKQTELAREAPISGAAVSGRALNAPVRLQRQQVARRPPLAARQAGPAPVGAAPAPPPPPPAPVSENPAVVVALAWQAAAQTPGASDLVKWYAAQAAADARA